MAEFAEAGKVDELKEGTMKAVNVGGQEILLARVGNKYYAAHNRCPHMKGDLSKGKLEGTLVTCPLHGSQFDITNGQVVRWLRGGLMSKIAKAFKTSKGINTYEVKVQGDKILVRAEF